MGASSLPYATGVVVGAVSGHGGPHGEFAYRMMFAAIAAPLAVGLLLYLRVKDAKPSGGR